MSSNQTVTQKAMKRQDGGEVPGSVLYDTMVRRTSTYALAFSARTVPLEFLVDVQSLQPYLTVYSLELH
jgi:hypothetical protein